MSKPIEQSCRRHRRGSALAILVVVMAILALVVAGAIRPVRDEADMATLRVEMTRAAYAAESGRIIIIKAVLGTPTMPTNGSSIVVNDQTIVFVQTPDAMADAIVEGKSGDATKQINFNAP